MNNNIKIIGNDSDELLKFIESHQHTEVDDIEIQIFFKKIHESAIIPYFSTVQSSGFDLIAIEDYTLIPGVITGVRTGLCIELPDPDITYPFTLEMQIRPRSGMAIKHGITIPNSPATIDNDYRGELVIPMTKMKYDINSISSYQIKAGDRVAQGVIVPIFTSNILKFSESVELNETERNTNGFGSTGI